MILVIMALIIINANGLVIPPAAWVLFGVDIVLRVLIAIVKTIQKD